MMKKILLLAFLVVGFTFYSTAQIKTPAASPSSKLEQTVGLTTVTIEYSRPGKKGRTIFAQDGLVPFGKQWRTGANAATKWTFSDDVKVGGQEVKAGSYAVISVPTASDWTFNLYNFDERYWSSYREKTPDVSFTAKSMDLGVEVETFTFDIGEIKTASANINLLWDNTLVSVPVEVEVDSKVMADIEKAMAGTSTGDYYTAATYYHDSGKDLNQALEWVQKATNVEKPRFWQVRREALILADLGRYKEAVKAANKSMELAQEAGNEDYVRMNKKSISDWNAKM